MSKNCGARGLVELRMLAGETGSAGCAGVGGGARVGAQRESGGAACGTADVGRSEGLRAPNWRARDEGFGPVFLPAHTATPGSRFVCEIASKKSGFRTNCARWRSRRRDLAQRTAHRRPWTPLRERNGSKKISISHKLCKMAVAAAGSCTAISLLPKSPCAVSEKKLPGLHKNVQ